MVKSWIVLFLGLVGLCQSYRILAFFPFPAKSHHFVFRPVMEELTKKGHEIVYVTGFPYLNPPAGIRQIDIEEYYNPLKEEKKFDQVAMGELSVPAVVMMLYEIGLLIGDISLGNPKVQQLIHSNEKFDAVMFESYFVQEFQSAFIHKFNAPAIEIMPLGDCAWVNELSGLPDNIAYQIDYKHENTNELNIRQRLYNWYVKTTLTLGGYFYLWKMQSMMDKHFNYTGWESRPPLTQLVSNRSLILTNSHHVLGYSVPLVPHRKEIGGINVKPNKPLPKELQNFMDGAKEGVIYMSLGSHINISEVASDIIREDFMSVFRELPQRVLMKWETDFPGKLPHNVKVSSWFPQQDILAHKNLVLFITHGGLLSLNEAVHHGVPVVGIPVFADQPKNMIQVESAGYGKIIRFRDLSRYRINATVREVLTNKRYKEEALRRSVIFRDRRHSPAEDAVYWIEYAIKYPNVLTPRGAYLSAIVLHNLDIMALFLLIMYLFISWFNTPKPSPKKSKKLKKN